MINSILKQTPDKIVIDKLECNGELITDETDIKHYTNIHFQTIAGVQPNDNLTSFIPDEWLDDYQPLSNIDRSVYDDLFSIPTFDEWESYVELAPTGKAPGPSKLSYDIIKKLGFLAKSVLYRITCSCFVLQTIPTAWKNAMIYPIPKPTAWCYNLSNTRPITLLESPRKLLVKIMNARLSNILSSHHILQTSQFAGLPGGSTSMPIQMIRNLLDDAAIHNKELWLYLQDLSKCYD